MTLILPSPPPPAAARFHYYATPQQLLPLLERGAVDEPYCPVFGREDAGLTNEELALADVLTGVPMAADYPSLNLGQSVMVYCYQLASLMQQRRPPPLRQTIISCRPYVLVPALLSRLGVEDDAKLADWLSQRLGLLQQRDTAMLHRLLHDIEKPARIKLCHIFIYGCVCCSMSWFSADLDVFLTAAGKYVSLLKWGKLRNSLT